MKTAFSCAALLLAAVAVADEAPVQEVPKPSDPAPEPAEVEAAPKAEAKGQVSETAKSIRVSIGITDGNPVSNPTTCKRNLQNRLDDELAKAGYSVTTTTQAEAVVSATLRGGKLNSRGTRVVWLVTAEMEVVRSASVNVVNGQKMDEVVAKERFDAKSGDARAPSLAQKQCADRLCDDVSAFAKDALAKIAEKVKVCEVKVTDACKKDDAKTYAANLAEIVGKMTGVYGCKVLAADETESIVSVEIVYDASAFPDGVALRLKTIKELNLAQ